MKKPKKKKGEPDKQRLSRGSSFIRMAKDCREIAKKFAPSKYTIRPPDTRWEDWNAHAEIYEAEAKKLRGMR